MLDYSNIEVKHLHTFSSEKIGVQYYYIVSMTLEDKYPIHFCVMADGDDVWEHCYDADDVDAEITQDDIENTMLDYAYCQTEVIASHKTINDAIEVANKTIEDYNNGAFVTIELNEYV